MSKVREIPGYQIIDKIGSGSTSTVWRARQESLNRDVAIKILHPELWTQIDEADAFLAEAHSVALLKSRHVIQVYDVGRLADTAYIVMEYIDGCTLAQHIQEMGRLPFREAMQIVAAIADALGDAWRSTGMIHRDIKPDNIIIEEDGSVKLADLGLARQIDAEAKDDTKEEIAGTPNYMSPEQATGAPQSSYQADMYSLGATLYHMLTGQIPFVGMPVEKILTAQITGQLPWPQDIDPQIPLSCCQFVARLMMKKPQDRYPEWTRVYADAVKIAEGRMLMVKLPADARSTIASAGKVPTGQKRVIRVKKPAGTQAAAIRSRQPQAVPAWIQRPLRITRTVVCVILIWQLFLKPILESTDRAHFASTVPQPAATQTPPARGTTPGDTPPPPRIQPDEDYDIYDDDGTSPDEDDHTQPTEEPNTIPLASRQQPVEQTILALLVQQRYDEAIQHWGQHADELQNRDDRETLSNFLIPRNMPDAIIGSVLARFTGREMPLQIGGQTTSVQIESVTGDIVQAMVKTQNGNSTIMRPREFRISQLAPVDQFRLLRSANNPFMSYAIGVLALQAADYQRAIEIAPLLGPLEHALREFAQARIDALTQP